MTIDTKVREAFLSDVRTERERQVVVEGYTAEHDDALTRDQWGVILDTLLHNEGTGDAARRRRALIEIAAVACAIAESEARKVVKGEQHER